MERKIKVSSLVSNPNNPRKIKKGQLKKLKKSIDKFPKMMKLRPIIIDENNVVLGGNMRLEAIRLLDFKEIPSEWVKKASDLTEEEKKEFIIKDNLAFGEWDWLILKDNFKDDLLFDFGFNVPDSKNTELLSGLEYQSIYYEPENEPNLTLWDCFDTSLYEKKIKALEKLKIPEDKKEVLKIFAQRFIKIDFEAVANYYEFNADEDEKKAIERLRLVLVDNSVNGFIEDDLIKILSFTDDYGND